MTEKTTTPSAKDTGTKRFHGIRLRTLNLVIVLIAAVVAIVFLQTVHDTRETYTSLEEASQDYIQCEQAASELKAASNYLTIQVRTYVATQQSEYLENYFTEVDVTQRREHSVASFEDIQGHTSSALQSALDHSNELMGLELYAMRLVAEAAGDNAAIEEHLSEVELSAEDEALSPEEKISRARGIVFGEEYMDYVALIESDVSTCKDNLIKSIDELQTANQSMLHGLLIRQRVLAIVLFLILVLMAVTIVALVLWPLGTYSAHIQNNDALPSKGAYELRRLAGAYNIMYEENMRNHDTLRRKAEHDHLTGLYNRSVFERLLQLHSEDHYALMLVDVDYFKEINDAFGHDKGDAALKKVAGLLSHAFRATDYPCRIGGDEFAVFMTEMTEDLSYVIENKVRALLASLQDSSDDLPSMTLSVGIAFSDGTNDGTVIFKHADEALYEVKEAGRDGYCFYGSEPKKA